MTMRILKKLMHRQALRLLSYLFGKMPMAQLKVLLIDILKRRSQSLPPADGLRLLLGLDVALYPVQGQLAVAYGGGVHTKHRHIRYHDFFVSRIQPKERVLDIGCGIGAVAYDVAKDAGAYVVGIDLSADNIAQARKRYAHPRIEYYVGDVLQELPDGSFDVIMLSKVLHHLPERLVFLRKVQEVAHPSRFLIREDNFERDWRVPLKRELGVEWRLEDDLYIEYTPESFAEEMAAAGLRVIYQEIRWGEIWAEVTN